jgi:predicted phage tail protein
MKRKIYLEGELADKFGKELNANVSSVREALLLINANYPDFKKYLVDSHDAGVGFAIDVAGIQVEEDDIILPLAEGDITIMSVPAGSKGSGPLKILAAIAIIAIVYLTGGFAAIGATMAGGGFTAGTAAALAGTQLAMSLAMAGIQQLMAPDPSVDEQSPQSYLFNGSEQNIIEGDPVPVLYGELRVPGRPISFAAYNASNTFSNYTQGFNQSANSLNFTFSSGLGINFYNPSITGVGI